MTVSVIADQVSLRMEHDGFAVIPDALGLVETGSLLTAVQGVSDAVAETARGGARRLFEVVPQIRALANHESVRGATVAVLGSECFPVRALLFDKTPDANWKVVWHQDLTIAVRARRDVEGYGPWSSKAGVPHVQPPIPVLERMVTVRIHLDNCGPDNGPVRVVPGSHRAGRIREAEIEGWRRKVAEVICVVSRGGILVMRPLLLHASSPARIPGHRRVIHIEYAATELADGLEWYESSHTPLSERSCGTDGTLRPVVRSRVPRNW